ncbi:M48 family metallopeptidase [Paucibacter sp. APW11]|uniref:M48 family metallopeptidase n=1 Tax=Roseateles aquae TaxID=3077235 RepID=A0ABU3PE00_9BURK|nr:M48 family metallopeptidase [Paucibacter sp. APW11]MDT9000783.1 M48 family metallopeptidase [Paucibacter sp. APW11]
MRQWLVALLMGFVLCQGAGAVDTAALPASAASEAGSASQSATSRPQFRVSPVDAGWAAGLPRDAEAATQAYLDRLPADVVARANAYFEGGYWLQLWNFLLGLAVAGVLLQGRRSARLRDWAARVSGQRSLLRDGLYGAAYGLASWLLTLPMSVYQGFYREHAYAMATQGFGAWFGEQLIGLAVGTLVLAVVVPLLYAVLRKAGERWWLWGTVLVSGLMMVMMVVAPLWIEPLFNTYKPVENGEIKTSVLALAHANGVPANDIYEFDASRQTTRVSANVAGLFGSAAVRLNDNLLRRSSLAEIRAVMGHELGHYVLNHIAKSICEFGLLMLAGFLFAQWAMERLLARRGHVWGLQGVSDVASLPLLAAVFSVFMLVATPISNSIVRTQELEADRFGLNLAREPHGMAEVMLKLVEYRKPDPGPLEEFVFFDHPSARTRIHEAMRWREAMGTP